MKKFLVCHLLYEEFPRDPRVRRYVNALNNSGIYCIILCSKKKHDKLFELWNGNCVYRIPVTKLRQSFIITFFEYLGFTAVSSFLLMYLGIKYRFKIIHVHTLPDYLVFAALINKIFGAKIILDLHEIFPELFIARKPHLENSFWVKILKLSEKWSIKLADKLITIHDNAKKIFLTRNKDIEKKLTVIMNGVDPAEYEQVNHIETEEFIIMYNGTVVKLLNLTIIIKALNSIRNSIPEKDFANIKFKIYGDGPALNEILSLADNLGLKNNVEYMGFIQPVEMNREVLKANVCILPPLKNLYSDLFYTIKLVEMIYLKIPVIATRLNTYKLYYGEDSLFYFDSGNDKQLVDRIKEVYYDKDEVKRKTENAYLDYMKVSWDKMKVKYIELINGILN